MLNLKSNLVNNDKPHLTPEEKFLRYLTFRQVTETKYVGSFVTLRLKTGDEDGDFPKDLRD